MFQDNLKSKQKTLNKKQNMCRKIFENSLLLSRACTGNYSIDSKRISLVLWLSGNY